MCATCGCEGEHHHEPARRRVGDVRKIVKLEHRLLAKNDQIAGENRAAFAAGGVLALNFVSSPGAGKTTLLERTIREAGLGVSVIEGDQATERDADRVRAAGANAVQINTGAGCHLDAEMVARAFRSLAPRRGELLAIENVGNLVCPALFDLGERAKVLIASVTEGDDKPLKYPHMFRAAELVLLNKIDLLPHVSFDVSRFVGDAREVNPNVRVLEVSATTGAGLEAWYRWLHHETDPRSRSVDDEARA